MGHALRELRLSKEQALLYPAEWKAIRRLGFPDDSDYYSGFSKLPGWPALVQRRDLDRLKISTMRSYFCKSTFIATAKTLNTGARRVAVLLHGATGFVGAEFRRMRVRNSVHLSRVAWDLEGAATERELP